MNMNLFVSNSHFIGHLFKKCFFLLGAGVLIQDDIAFEEIVEAYVKVRPHYVTQYYTALLHNTDGTAIFWRDQHHVHHIFMPHSIPKPQ